MMKISRLLTRLRDRPVRAVVAGQPAERRERLLDREVLARMVERVDEDLGLRLVVVDVVADLAAQMSRPW